MIVLMIIIGAVVAFVVFRVQDKPVQEIRKLLNYTSLDYDVQYIVQLDDGRIQFDLPKITENILHGEYDIDEVKKSSTITITSRRSGADLWSVKLPLTSSWESGEPLGIPKRYSNYNLTGICLQLQYESNEWRMFPNSHVKQLDRALEYGCSPTIPGYNEDFPGEYKYLPVEKFQVQLYARKTTISYTEFKADAVSSGPSDFAVILIIIFAVMFFSIPMYTQYRIRHPKRSITKVDKFLFENKFLSRLGKDDQMELGHSFRNE